MANCHPLRRKRLRIFSVNCAMVSALYSARKGANGERSCKIYLKVWTRFQKHSRKYLYDDGQKKMMSAESPNEKILYVLSFLALRKSLTN